MAGLFAALATACVAAAAAGARTDAPASDGGDGGSGPGLGTATGARPAATAPASPADWTLSLRLDHHLDALALAEAGRDDAVSRLRLDRAGRQLGRVDDEWRLSRRLDAGWQLGVLGRQSARLSVSRATLEAALSADGHTSATQDSRWPVRLRLSAWSGQGLVLGRQLALGSWVPGTTLEVEGQALRLDRWRQRRIDGQVLHEAATDDYSGWLRSTAMDTRTTAPFAQPAAAHGQALLFSGRLSHAAAADGPAAGSRLWLAWQDAGWLRWRGRSVEQATLDTDATWRDADGYLVYSPLIVGHWQGRNDPAWQRPDWRLGAELSGRLLRRLWLAACGAAAAGPTAEAVAGTTTTGCAPASGDDPTWGLTLQHQAGHGWRQGWQWQRRAGAGDPRGPAAAVTGTWTWQAVSWIPRERRLSLRVGHPQGWLDLGADRIDRGARSLQLTLGWIWRDDTAAGPR